MARKKRDEKELGLAPRLGSDVKRSRADGRRGRRGGEGRKPELDFVETGETEGDVKNKLDEVIGKVNSLLTRLETLKDPTQKEGLKNQGIISRLNSLLAELTSLGDITLQRLIDIESEVESIEAAPQEQEPRKMEVVEEEPKQEVLEPEIDYAPWESLAPDRIIKLPGKPGKFLVTKKDENGAYFKEYREGDSPEDILNGKVKSMSSFSWTRKKYEEDHFRELVKQRIPLVFKAGEAYKKSADELFDLMEEAEGKGLKFDLDGKIKKAIHGWIGKLRWFDSIADNVDAIVKWVNDGHSIDEFISRLNHFAEENRKKTEELKSKTQELEKGGKYNLEEVKEEADKFIRIAKVFKEKEAYWRKLISDLRDRGATDEIDDRLDKEVKRNIFNIDFLKDTIGFGVESVVKWLETGHSFSDVISSLEKNASELELSIADLEDRLLQIRVEQEAAAAVSEKSLEKGEKQGHDDHWYRHELASEIYHKDTILYSLLHDLKKLPHWSDEEDRKILVQEAEGLMTEWEQRPDWAMYKELSGMTLDEKAQLVFEKYPNLEKDYEELGKRYDDYIQKMEAIIAELKGAEEKPIPEVRQEADEAGLFASLDKIRELVGRNERKIDDFSDLAAEFISRGPSEMVGGLDKMDLTNDEFREIADDLDRCRLIFYRRDNKEVPEAFLKRVLHLFQFLEEILPALDGFNKVLKEALAKEVERATEPAPEPHFEPEPVEPKRRSEKLGLEEEALIFELMKHGLSADQARAKAELINDIENVPAVIYGRFDKIIKIISDKNFNFDSDKIDDILNFKENSEILSKFSPEAIKEAMIMTKQYLDAMALSVEAITGETFYKKALSFVKKIAPDLVGGTALPMAIGLAASGPLGWGGLAVAASAVGARMAYITASNVLRNSRIEKRKQEILATLEQDTSSWKGLKGEMVMNITRALSQAEKRELLGSGDGFEASFLGVKNNLMERDLGLSEDELNDQAAKISLLLNMAKENNQVFSEVERKPANEGFYQKYLKEHGLSAKLATAVVFAAGGALAKSVPFLRSGMFAFSGWKLGGLAGDYLVARANKLRSVESFIPQKMTESDACHLRLEIMDLSSHGRKTPDLVKRLEILGQYEAKKALNMAGFEGIDKLDALISKENNSIREDQDIWAKFDKRQKVLKIFLKAGGAVAGAFLGGVLGDISRLWRGSSHQAPGQTPTPEQAATPKSTPLENTATPKPTPEVTPDVPAANRPAAPENAPRVLNVDFNAPNSPRYLEHSLNSLSVKEMPSNILDHLKNSGGNLDEVNAARTLNVSANLRVLMSGGHIRGIDAGNVKDIVSFDGNELKIADQAEFHNLMSKLWEHAQEKITEDNVSKMGATAYLDDYSQKTWHEMLADSGLKVADGNFSTSKTVDSANEILRRIQEQAPQAGLDISGQGAPQAEIPPAAPGSFFNKADDFIEGMRGRYDAIVNASPNDAEKKISELGLDVNKYVIFGEGSKTHVVEKASLAREVNSSGYEFKFGQNYPKSERLVEGILRKDLHLDPQNYHFSPGKTGGIFVKKVGWFDQMLNG